MKKRSFWSGVIAGGVFGIIISNVLMGKSKICMDTGRFMETTRHLRGRARRLLRRGESVMRVVRNKI